MITRKLNNWWETSRARFLRACWDLRKKLPFPTKFLRLFPVSQQENSLMRWANVIATWKKRKTSTTTNSKRNTRPISSFVVGPSIRPRTATTIRRQTTNSPHATNPFSNTKTPPNSTTTYATIYSSNPAWRTVKWRRSRSATTPRKYWIKKLIWACGCSIRTEQQCQCWLQSDMSQTSQSD